MSSDDQWFPASEPSVAEPMRNDKHPQHCPQHCPPNIHQLVNLCQKLPLIPPKVAESLLPSAKCVVLTSSSTFEHETQSGRLPLPLLPKTLWQHMNGPKPQHTAFISQMCVSLVRL